MSRFSLTKWAWFLLCLSLVFLRVSRPPDRVLSWDTFGYYLYLPATVIYNDPGLEDPVWLDTLFERYDPSATFYQATSQPNGRWVIKYPMGMALVYSPFFFIAHGLAPILGYPDDGMSLPYAYILCIGALLYAFAGLWFLRKILLRYFNEKLSALLLILIAIGTNYVQLTAFDGTLLTHSLEFSLFAALFWLTIRWHEEPTRSRVEKIGLLLGLITIVRPSEALVVLIPVLYGLGSKDIWSQKIIALRKNPWQILAAILFGLIAVSPQILYWKYTSGQFFFYSYINPGEGFEFLKPYTLDFLFSFRKGWFIYTPLMLFAIAGFISLWRKNRALFYAFSIYMILNVWLISSWTCWWYAGGSFSSRAIIPAYVFLVIPLGYFLEWVFKKKSLRIPMALILGFFVVLNLFQTWQFQEGIISKERMTRDYYIRIFGKISVDPEDEKLLLVERTVDAFGRMPSEQDYTESILFVDDFDGDSNGVFALHPNRPFSEGPDIAFKDLTNADHAWLRISCRLFLPEDLVGDLPVVVATFHHEGEAYMYNALAANDSIRGEWQTLSFDYLTPEVRSPEDNFKAYAWYMGNDTIWVDDFEIRMFELK